jgi:hypothetical protein
VLDDLRMEFYHLYVNTKDIYLIGRYLSVVFYYISTHILSIESHVINLANDWYSFYDWVQHNLGGSNLLNELVRYADDIISFIRYPFDFIIDSIRDNLPALYRIANDPVEWVLETIYRYTGLDIDFVDNPYRVIDNLINSALGELREIAHDPYGWVVNLLGNIIPDFFGLISNAGGWVRNLIEREYPFIVAFLNDPDGFIEDKLLDFIENATSKYLERVVKAGERILNNIF